MRCTELRGWARWVGALCLAGCSTSTGIRHAAAGPTASASDSQRHVAAAPGPARAHPREPAAALGEPRRVRNWAEVRQQAAERMMAANPLGTYSGAAPEALLAIPVLEVELNGDGSVRRIIVLRHPRQAKDTVELATQAVRRAAPFGDVSRLPRPWKFVETFLFDDERRFKPRTLEP